MLAQAVVVGNTGDCCHLRKTGLFGLVSARNGNLVRRGFAGFSCFGDLRRSGGINAAPGPLVIEGAKLCLLTQPAKAKGDYEMKNILIQTAAVLALTVTATAMSAQSEIDADGDGLLSYNELLAAYPDMTEAAFMAIDTNADGAVDADELKLAQEAGLLPT
jgi:hypothetical protein